MAGVKEVLAGRYELLDVLGRGGMGVVYRARDRVLDRIVAVKVLPLDRAQDPTLVARFEREARAAGGLSHRNIVAVFDLGTDQETRFIVMEYLTGESLSERLRVRGSLGVTEAVDVAAQVAAALAAAHSGGIVHRDVKPANVMVDAHGHVKVLDFGIARLTAGSSLTQTATVLGSAPYLAPELCRGAAADARSDIYALGCVLYELVTGRPPFTGEVPAAVVHQQISSAPRSPERLNREVPPALGGLILAMLDKDPGRRPQDAGDLARTLPETLTRPASAAAGSVPPDAAATAPLAPLAPLAPVDGSEATRVMPLRPGAPSAPTRVMPLHSDAGRPAVRTAALLTGIVLVALVIALLALSGASGRPHGKAALHRTRATTGRVRTGAATSTTAATATTGPNPATTQGTTSTPSRGAGPGGGSPAAGPPGKQPGGPHEKGPPPGKHKKHGPGGKHGNE
jgi:serine/threonine-protein kinase